jgi:hypothetical protein
MQHCIHNLPGGLRHHCALLTTGLDYVASTLLYGCFYGLDYVVLLWSELCLCLASMIHLWATIRGVSFTVTSSLSLHSSLLPLQATHLPVLPTREHHKQGASWKVWD